METGEASLDEGKHCSPRCSGSASGKESMQERIKERRKRNQTEGHFELRLSLPSEARRGKKSKARRLLDDARTVERSKSIIQDSKC